MVLGSGQFLMSEIPVYGGWEIALDDAFHDSESALQGYLAHKNPPHPKLLQQDYT